MTLYLRLLLVARRTVNRLIAARCSKCPDVETITAYVEERLSPPEVEALQEHIAVCDDCAEVALGAFEFLEDLRRPLTEEERCAI